MVGARAAAALAATSLVVAGCAESSGAGEAAGFVTVAFSASPAGAAPAPGDSLRLEAPAPDTAALVVTGTNGALTITGVRLLVRGLELEPAPGGCDAAPTAGDRCGQFDAGLRVVDLPLRGGQAVVVAQPLGAGTYTAVKFQVARRVTADRDIVRATDRPSGAPDWPPAASVMVTGTFRPRAGEPRPFTIYLDAGLDVSLGLAPPLVIGGEARSIAVEIDPRAWFTNLDGSVMDLSAADHAATGEVLEFRGKAADAFSGLAVEQADT